jgi:hypothetical protein
MKITECHLRYKCYAFNERSILSFNLAGNCNRVRQILQPLQPFVWFILWLMSSAASYHNTVQKSQSFFLTISIYVPDDNSWVQPRKVQSQESTNSTASTSYKNNLAWHVLKWTKIYFKNSKTHHLRIKRSNSIVCRCCSTKENNLFTRA